MLGGDINVSEEIKQQARDQLGLNGSYLEQYWRWISGAFTGDFGEVPAELRAGLGRARAGAADHARARLPRAPHRRRRRRPARRRLGRRATAVGLRVARHRPARRQHPELLPRDAPAPLHLEGVRLGAAALVGLALRGSVDEPAAGDPAGGLDLGLHDGDRDAHGARDDARGARPGLRPHRARQGRAAQGRDLATRAPQRVDPGRHRRRLRGRRPHGRRRDRRGHLRPSGDRQHPAHRGLEPRLPGDPGGDAPDRRIFIFFNLVVDVLYGILDPRISQE